MRSYRPSQLFIISIQFYWLSSAAATTHNHDYQQQKEKLVNNYL